MASDFLQECCDFLGGMKGCIVEDDYITLLKLRDERLFQPFDKEITIAISSEDDGGKQGIFFESSDQIDAFAGRPAPLFLCFTPQPFGCPAVGVNFVTIHARLIHPDTL